MFTNASWFSVSSRVVYSMSFRIPFLWGLRMKVNHLSCGPGQLWWQRLGLEFPAAQLGLATAGSTYV